MTPKEKISLLQSMKRVLENGEGSGCLCGAYYHVTGIMPNNEERLTDLGLRKPKQYYRKVFWYRPYNIKPRIKQINKAIRELSKCK